MGRAMQREDMPQAGGLLAARLSQKRELHICVRLVNMFNPAAVNLKQEPNFFEDLKKETEAEAKKFGKLVACHVSQNQPNGRVYLKFKNADQAQACQLAFDKRW